MFRWPRSRRCIFSYRCFAIGFTSSESDRNQLHCCCLSTLGLMLVQFKVAFFSIMLSWVFQKRNGIMFTCLSGFSQFRGGSRRSSGKQQHRCSNNWSQSAPRKVRSLRLGGGGGGGCCNLRLSSQGSSQQVTGDYFRIFHMGKRVIDIINKKNMLSNFSLRTHSLLPQGAS